MYAIGIDIGGTNIRIGLVDRNKNLSAFEQFPQDSVLKEDGPEALARLVKEYINRHRAEGRVAALCAAFPAAVSKDHATVLNAPNIKGFNGVNVKAYLSVRLEFPIHIEKDTNALLYHDLNYYKIAEEGVTIAIYAGTGLGNAIYVNGNILTGNNGVAGELGHIPAWDCEERCACGNIGCVESFVGGKYLDCIRKENFPGASMSELFAKHTGHPLIDKYIKRLAAVVATEINILDPGTVILGGGVVSMTGFPNDTLIKYIRGYARKPLPEASLKFIFSQNNGENGVIGAGLMAWEQVNKA